MLVQLFLVYYGLAQFDAVRNSPMWPYLRDPFWCATVTMTLHTAAYIAEILRGAIQAIPPGEIEAARALGMSKPKAMFYIILPRAARIGLPAYSNEVILMLKASALASTVTLLELTGMARTIIARTYLPVEIFFAVRRVSSGDAYCWCASSCWRRLRVDAAKGAELPRADGETYSPASRTETFLTAHQRCGNLDRSLIFSFLGSVLPGAGSCSGRSLQDAKMLTTLPILRGAGAVAHWRRCR